MSTDLVTTATDTRFVVCDGAEMVLTDPFPSRREAEEHAASLSPECSYLIVEVGPDPLPEPPIVSWADHVELHADYSGHVWAEAVWKRQLEDALPIELRVDFEFDGERWHMEREGDDSAGVMWAAQDKEHDPAWLKQYGEALVEAAEMLAAVRAGDRR